MWKFSIHLIYMLQYFLVKILAYWLYYWYYLLLFEICHFSHMKNLCLFSKHKFITIFSITADKMFGCFAEVFYTFNLYLAIFFGEDFSILAILLVLSVTFWNMSFFTYEAFFTLDKMFGKNVRLRKHIFVFLSINLQSSLRCIGHLAIKKNLVFY